MGGHSITYSYISPKTVSAKKREMPTPHTYETDFSGVDASLEGVLYVCEASGDVHRLVLSDNDAPPDKIVKSSRILPLFDQQQRSSGNQASVTAQACAVDWVNERVYAIASDQVTKLNSRNFTGSVLLDSLKKMELTGEFSMNSVKSWVELT